MLLSPEAVPTGDGWTLEVKWDGCGAQLRYDGRGVRAHAQRARVLQEVPERSAVAGELGMAA